MSRKWGVGIITAGAVMLMMWLSTAPAPSLFTTPKMPIRLPKAPRRTPVMTVTSSSASTAPDSSSSEIRHATMSETASTLWTILAAAVILAALAALTIWAYRAVQRLREDPAEDVELPALPEVPAALVQQPETFRALLAHGEARNAIVACWARLEDATREAGVPMAAHETSSEYTERVITGWVTDGSALRELAALYREARFSAHRMGEPDRAAAGRALDELLGDLRDTWEVRHDRA